MDRLAGLVRRSGRRGGTIAHAGSHGASANLRPEVSRRWAGRRGSATRLHRRRARRRLHRTRRCHDGAADFLLARADRLRMCRAGPGLDRGSRDVSTSRNSACTGSAGGVVVVLGLPFAECRRGRRLLSMQATANRRAHVGSRRRRSRRAALHGGQSGLRLTGPQAAARTPVGAATNRPRSPARGACPGGPRRPPPSPGC